MATLRGEAVLLYVNTGSISVPVYTALGSDQSCTLNCTASMIDRADKSDAGWPNNIMGKREWNVSANGIHVETDAAFDALRASWMNQETILIKVKTINGNQFTGDAGVTNLSYTAPTNDVVKLTMTLNGASALVEATAT